MLNTRRADHERDAIFHECFHYAEHRMFFQLQQLHNTDVSVLSKWKPVSLEKSERSPIEWIEWQAHIGSQCLQMPRKLLRERIAAELCDMPYAQFMGYRRSEDGTPEIVEAEAKIIRTIFRRFLEGATPAMIARELNLAGIPCPSRKSLLSENEIEAAKARKKTARWSASTIESILSNEKYKGDAILQKTYCTDYIRKTFVKNDGSEIPRYYAENSHPAIVSTEVFELTQMEMAWRRSLSGHYSGKSCFSSRVVCGECGAFYGSKVWHSTDEYRRIVWRCNGKYKGDKKCSTPHVTQDEMEKAFVAAIQGLIVQKEAVFAAKPPLLIPLIRLNSIGSQLSCRIRRWAC